MALDVAPTPAPPGLVGSTLDALPGVLRLGALAVAQVVEAQPDVLEAVHSVRSAKLIRRSIHLTPFGQDFARICFAEADELAALSAHEAPPDAATESPVSD